MNATAAAMKCEEGVTFGILMFQLCFQSGAGTWRQGGTSGRVHALSCGVANLQWTALPIKQVERARRRMHVSVNYTYSEYSCWMTPPPSSHVEYALCPGIYRTPFRHVSFPYTEI